MASIPISPPKPQSNIPMFRKASCSPRTSMKLPIMKEEGKGDMCQSVFDSSKEDMDSESTRSMLSSSASAAAATSAPKNVTICAAPKRRIKQGDMKTPVSTNTCPGSKSVDVSILYTGSPIRMESTTSSVAPPYHRNSPTYLGLYQQQRQHEEQSVLREMESCKTLPSLHVMSSDSAFDDSLEWDYTNQNQCVEICTQTSPTVITVDRASSSIPIESSISKESLLENQTKPLSVIHMEQMTELEESDDMDDVSSDIDDDQHPWETVQIQSHLAPIESKCEIVFCQADALKMKETTNVSKVEVTDTGISEQVEKCDSAESHHSVELEKKSNVVFCLENGFTSAAASNKDFSARAGMKVGQNATDLAAQQKNNVRPNQSATIISENRIQTNPHSCTQSMERNLENQVKKEMEYCVTYAKSDKSMNHYYDEKPVVGDQHTSAPFLQDWQSEQMPELNTSLSGKAIEIQPSPAPLTLNELKRNYAPKKHLEYNEPAIILPQKSSLILQHSHSKHGKVLKSSYEIFNSTSFLQGYKVLVNATASDRLHVSPSMGLISPHGRITVHFTTNEYSSKVLAKFRISVKTFRVHCGDDPKKLKEYYTRLEEQHPELIQVKTIDRVLVWNNKDLPEMLDVINSVSDMRERDALKEQLHHEQSKDMQQTMQRPNRMTSSMQQLSNIKMAMIVANQNLNNVFLELNAIRNTLGFLSIIAIIVYGIFSILPGFMEDNLTAEIPVSLPAEVETESSFLEKFWELLGWFDGTEET